MKQQTATSLLNRLTGGGAGSGGATDGEIAAAADLLPLVYDELHALAAAYFRDERDSHTLQPTALVHEAYLRLVDQTSVQWRSRNQFFVIAAKAMRNILVDHARTRNRLKRGGGGVGVGGEKQWQQVTLAAVEQTLGAGNGGGVGAGIDMERIHAALQKLAVLDQRKATLVELRFFAGVSEEQAAEILDIARSTASEEWRMARAWLHRELKGAADE
jgi:RNA polymerase sigma factor (TIGR02999 family)